MKITLFKNIRETKTPMHVDVSRVLKRIREGKSIELLKLIRNEKNKEKRQELKKGLPSICFSGMFRERAVNKLLSHSGLICLDFDNFEDITVLNEWKEQFKADKFTFACFVSPSGYGLKVLVKIPPEKNDHKIYFEALREYYDTDYFDQSGSDVSRVCFESYDSDLYHNPESEVFNEKKEIEEYSYSNLKKGVIPLKDEYTIIQRLEKWWSSKYSFTEGSRNDNIFKLACAFSDFGISQLTCESHFKKFIEPNFKEVEIRTTIVSAYKKAKPNFGTKFFEDYETKKFIANGLLVGKSTQEIKSQLEKKGYKGDDVDDILEEVESDEDVNIYYQNVKGRFSIIARKFKEFLQINGFFRYVNNEGEAYRYIRIENNLISFISLEGIKDFVLTDLLKKEKYKVFEYLAKTPKYFKDDFLNILDIKNVPILKDTKYKAYFFYNNCVAIVSKKGIETVDYLDLEDGFVFKKRINKRDFKVSNNLENDFKSFIYNVSGQSLVNEKSFKSTIGYLLHSYKSSSKSPAVILNDECISENPEGGTGKGIFTKALGYLRRSAVLDGKNYNHKEKFSLQTVTPETEIVAFDDIEKNFKFEALFSLITEGIVLEYKNVNAIKIDFENSPKILISTNYTVRGDGNSHDRRKWELEFAQYYHRNLTPEEEFNRQLFYDWNDDDWLAFDNYMLRCVQLYLINNCKMYEPEFKNLEIRKFINKTSMEFLTWADDEQNSKIKQVRVSKALLFEDFTTEYPDYKKRLTRKTFFIWLKKYAVFKNISCDQGNSNGVRWVTLGFNDPVTNKEIKEIEKISF